MTKKLTVVGACNVDLISYVDRLPKAGETVCGSTYETGFGGKGANQCCAAANLLPENTCQLITGLGDDHHGRSYLTHLNSLKIDTSNVQIFKNETTGVAPISVDTNTGENSIIIIPGANLKFTVEGIEEKCLKNSSLILCQNESNLETTAAALKFGVDNKITTVVNPSPVEGIPETVLENANILVLNEHELGAIARQSEGASAGDGAGEGAGTGGDNSRPKQAQVKHLFEKFQNLKFIIETTGPQGATVFGKMADEFTNIVSKKIPIKRTVGKVVDTTGAGDCFLGSFAAYFHKNVDGQVDMKMCNFADVYCRVCEAVSFGCEVASVSVEKRGTSKSYPKVLELVEYGIEF